MEFNATFLATIFTFIVFVIVMNKVLYAPILSIMQKRQDIINENYKNAQTHTQQAEELNIKKDEIIKSAKTEAIDIVKTASDNAKEKKEAEIKIAKEDAQNKIDSNKNKLIEESKKVKSEIRNEMNNIVQNIISKVLNENIEISLDENKLKEYLNVK